MCNYLLYLLVTALVWISGVHFIARAVKAVADNRMYCNQTAIYKQLIYYVFNQTASDFPNFRPFFRDLMATFAVSDSYFAVLKTLQQTFHL